MRSFQYASPVVLLGPLLTTMFSLSVQSSAQDLSKFLANWSVRGSDRTVQERLLCRGYDPCSTVPGDRFRCVERSACEVSNVVMLKRVRGNL